MNCRNLKGNQMKLETSRELSSKFEEMRSFGLFWIKTLDAAKRCRAHAEVCAPSERQTAELSERRFREMHDDGVDWITTTVAAKVVRNRVTSGAAPDEPVAPTRKTIRNWLLAFWSAVLLLAVFFFS
jgi:hypothetical protein